MNNANLKRNMTWNAVGNLLFLGSQWFITILVANIGRFTDAGILSIAMSVSATFQTISVFGIRSYQISDTENKYSDTCYVGFRLITCTVATLACLIFSIVARYPIDQILSISLFMLFRLADNFSDVLYGIEHKNDRLDLVGKSYTIKAPLTLAAFVLGYKLTDSLNVGLLLMAIASWAVTVFYDVLSTRKLSDFHLWQKKLPWLGLARTTAPLCVYLFLSAAISTVPKLILEQQLGEEILGIYSSIFAPALLISTISGYLYTPFVPYFADAYAKRDIRAFMRTFIKITVAIASVAVITVVAAIFLGDFALKILFGEKILAYSYMLIPILISIFACAVFAFLCTLGVVLRDFVGLLVACGAGLVCEVVVTGRWIELSGINATSYGYILASCVGAVILLARMLYILYGKHKKGV